MILIDNEKSILAGEGKILMAELAATVDRYFAEMEKGTSGDITYEEIFEEFIRTIKKAAKFRMKGNESPHDIVMDGSLTKNSIFEKRSANKGLSLDNIDDLLEQAAAKLKLKKKKKTKNKGKSKKKDK
jgi:hypothetical protein